MKQSIINLLVSICISISCLTSCNTAEDSLLNTISEINKSCPVKIDGFGDISGITYENDSVIMLYNITEQEINLAAYNGNQKEFKNLAQMMVAGFYQDNSVKEFLDFIISSDVNFGIKYNNPQTGTKAMCVLNSQEIKDGIEMYKDMRSELLSLNIEVNGLNIRLPENVDECTTLEKVYIDGENLVYEYSCTSDDAGWRNFTKVKEQFKEYNIKQLKTNCAANAEAKEFIHNLWTCNFEVKYLYKRTGTQQNMLITLNSGDLHDILSSSLNSLIHYNKYFNK